MKAGEFEPWQCVGLCSSDLKPDQVRTRRGHTEGQYDSGALSTRTLMTLLRDRSEYLTAHTQCFYKTYWNLANFCLYDCLSIHIHQIMQLAILLSQPWRLLHLLLSNQVFIVFSEGLHQLQDSLFFRENRQTRQNRASGWTCFSGFSTWFNTPTAPTPFWRRFSSADIDFSMASAVRTCGDTGVLTRWGRLDDPASLQDMN